MCCYAASETWTLSIKPVSEFYYPGDNLTCVSEMNISSSEFEWRDAADLRVVGGPVLTIDRAMVVNESFEFRCWARLGDAWLKTRIIRFNVLPLALNGWYHNHVDSKSIRLVLILFT